MEPLTDTKTMLQEISRLRKLGLPAFVLNYGLVNKIPPERLSDSLASASLVVQLYGRPLINTIGGMRSRVASVEDAMVVGADAIALQLSPDRISLDRSLEDIYETLEHARKYGLPTLLMLSKGRWASTDEFCDHVRSFAGLPIDLLKVGIEGIENELDQVDISGYPIPVLLAGGKINHRIAENIEDSREAGFAGFCLGRNLFGSSESANIIEAILGQANLNLGEVEPSDAE